MATTALSSSRRITAATMMPIPMAIETRSNLNPAAAETKQKKRVESMKISHFPTITFLYVYDIFTWFCLAF